MFLKKNEKNNRNLGFYEKEIEFDKLKVSGSKLLNKIMTTDEKKSEEKKVFDASIINNQRNLELREPKFDKLHRNSRISTFCHNKLNRNKYRGNEDNFSFNK